MVKMQPHKEKDRCMEQNRELQNTEVNPDAQGRFMIKETFQMVERWAV